MLYKIPDDKYHGSYIDLDCIQSIHPEYEEISHWNKDWPDIPPHMTQGKEILLYTITLTNGQEFHLKIEDYKTFEKVLIKKGLIIPDEEEE